MTADFINCYFIVLLFNSLLLYLLIGLTTFTTLI